MCWDSGVGLISLEHQVAALAAQFIFFAVSEGNHPLQLVLCSRIHEMSMHKWGVSDFSWFSILVAPYLHLDLIFGEGSADLGTK